MCERVCVCVCVGWVTAGLAALRSSLCGFPMDIPITRTFSTDFNTRSNGLLKPKDPLRGISIHELKASDTCWTTWLNEGSAGIYGQGLK
ncbi:hypothetical protein OJAV_G00087580 [Oryzias javanicus]|uniref:Secreted protein n=1 Tax=Oryzias javanicus TaxID=123683 RepID=A0A3S2MVV2_ORYJA|nr:hypothetical protein OJAV_G00087580 [Oryzias javanicus]